MSSDALEPNIVLECLRPAKVKSVFHSCPLITIETRCWRFTIAFSAVLELGQSNCRTVVCAPELSLASRLTCSSRFAHSRLEFSSLQSIQRDSSERVRLEREIGQFARCSTGHSVWSGARAARGHRLGTQSLHSLLSRSSVTVHGPKAAHWWPSTTDRH